MKIPAICLLALAAGTASAQGIEVIVSSGDKDLSQLVNEHITIIDTMNGKRRDVAGVTTEFGVPPTLMVDYQTLVGDAVDNVPGVEKVGPKTAAKWLSEYGSLDALVAAAAKLPRIAIAPPENRSVIGRTTADAMLIGVFWGYVAMMEGLIARMRREIGEPALVIATGGLAVLFDRHTEIFDHVDADLTRELLQRLLRVRRQGGALRA